MARNAEEAPGHIFATIASFVPSLSKDVPQARCLQHVLRRRSARTGKERTGRKPQSVFAIAPAVSTMRFEKPHSLSYQLSTRTSLPSITEVSRLSTVEEAGA